MLLNHTEKESKHYYELQYVSGDTEKEFDIRQDWNPFCAIVNGLNIAAIQNIIQEGIYGSGPRRFMLECSSELTEQNQTDVLSAWTNYDSLTGYKAVKVEEISKLSFDMREAILPTYKLENAALDIYDAPTKLIYKNTVLAYRTEFYRVKGLIEAASNKEGVDSAVSTVNYPTQLVE